MDSQYLVSRRQVLAGSLVTALGVRTRRKLLADDASNSATDDKDKALIAITLDLEMSRNFPTWETTHWDYEKGNLNDETKNYTAEACRRVKASGGILPRFRRGPGAGARKR